MYWGVHTVWDVKFSFSACLVDITLVVSKTFFHLDTSTPCPTAIPYTKLQFRSLVITHYNFSINSFCGTMIQFRPYTKHWTSVPSFIQIYNFLLQLSLARIHGLSDKIIILCTANCESIKSLVYNHIWYLISLYY